MKKKTAAVKKKAATKSGVKKKKAAVLKNVAAANKKPAVQSKGKKTTHSAQKSAPDLTIETAENPNITPPYNPLAWMDTLDSADSPVADVVDSTIPATEPDDKQSRDLEKGETLKMVGISNQPEDEGFGFFTDDESPVAVAEGADVLDLGATLTMRNIEQWYNQLDTALAGTSNVQLEAGALEQIDGTGLQLLCGFVKSAQLLDMSVHWGGTSTRFLQSVGYFGANKILGLDAKKIAA